MKKKFEPRTAAQLIPGSSYRLQLGTVKHQWYLKVYRGPTQVATQPLNGIDVYQITRLATTAIPVPGMNPLAVRKAVVQLIPTIYSEPNTDKNREKNEFKNLKENLQKSRFFMETNKENTL